MSKIAVSTYKVFAAAFRSAGFILVVSSCSGCFGGGETKNKSVIPNTVAAKVDSGMRPVSAVPDTVGKQTYMPPVISEEAMQRAVVSKADSIFHVYNNIRADYRIIGYESPDTNSKKMVLFSVFTSDVEDNPFHCPYGSYYDTGSPIELVVKYTGKQGSFIVASISGGSKKPATIYFEKKWVEFEE